MKTAAPVKVILLCVSLMMVGVSCEDSSDGDGGFPRTLRVSANGSGGGIFTATEAGTYTFAITSGAYTLWTPSRNWYTQLFFYENRPIVWGPLGASQYPRSEDGELGLKTSGLTQGEASTAAVGQGVTLTLAVDEYVTFLVPDTENLYYDNQGSVNLLVSQGL